VNECETKNGAGIEPTRTVQYTALGAWQFI